MRYALARIVVGRQAHVVEAIARVRPRRSRPSARTRTYCPGACVVALPQPALRPRPAGVGATGHRCAPASHAAQRPSRPAKPRTVGLAVQPRHGQRPPRERAARTRAAAPATARSVQPGHEPRDRPREVGEPEGVLVDAEQLQERRRNSLLCAMPLPYAGGQRRRGSRGSARSAAGRRSCPPAPSAR